MIDRFFGRAHGTSKRTKRPGQIRRMVPTFEVLEERCVPASFLSSILEFGQINTFEDQSREAFVDVDGNNTLSVGDVLVGFVRIDDHDPVVDGFGTIDNRIYAIFSQEVSAITPDGSTFLVDFAPTTVAGLTMSELSGVALPTTSIVAVYSNDTPIDNLLLNSPGDNTGNGTTNLFDYFDEIKADMTLNVVAGFGTGPTQGDDYFRARADFLDLSGIATLPASVPVAEFRAGLSILVNNDPNVLYSELVVSNKQAGSGPTLHQLAIANGAVRGTAANPPVSNVGEWDNINPDLSFNNPGGFINDADFFVYPTRVQPKAALGDFVWHDQNANGIQDTGEAGVPNVTVTLTGGGADGVIGTGGDDTTTTTTTDATGFYKFENLTPGVEYKVTFTLPSDYISFTQHNQGGDDALDSDADPANGMTQIVTLASGEFNDTLDAGLLAPAKLGDFVWNDLDEDGIQDAGEPGVSGITVTLSGTDVFGDAVSDSTTTDGNGLYLFDNLIPGDYKVTFSGIPNTFIGFTQQNQGGDDTIDSDADITNGMTQTVTLASGGENLTLDAGLLAAVPGVNIVKLTNDTDNNSPTGPVVPVGSTVTFTYIVTNTGNVPLGDVVVTDDQGVTVSFVGGDTDGNNLLDLTETWTYTASTIATAGQYVNNGTVTGNPVDQDGNDIPGLNDQTDTDIDHHFGVAPAIQLIKTAGDAADGAVEVIDSPQNVTFTYTVTNTGDTPLEIVSLIDDNGTPADNSDDFDVVTTGTFVGGDADNDGLLDLTETWTYTAVVFVSAAQTNVAVVTGNPTDDQGNDLSNIGNVTDNDDAVVRIAAIDIEKYVKSIVVDEGLEGLTPGFWKTHSEFGPAPLSGWPETGKGPLDNYEAIFGFTHSDIDDNLTLLDALNANGGGINALLRHSTAALLNACHPNINYEFSADLVKYMTKLAIESGDAGQIEETKDQFDFANNRGADLSNGGGGGGSGDMSGLGSDADEPPGPTFTVGQVIMFTYVVTASGAPLSNVMVTDQLVDPDTDNAIDAVFMPNFIGGDTDGDGVLDLEEVWMYASLATVTEGLHKNISSAKGTIDGTDVLVGPDTDPAHWTGVGDSDNGDDDATGQGLTPGFWKQPHHSSFWTGNEPADSYEVVFGVDVNNDGLTTTPTPTLLDALSTGGGGMNALLRHSTAALLNAASADVDYAFTVDEVIAMVQAAFASGDFESAKNTLEAQNQLGGDLKSSPSSTDTTSTEPAAASSVANALNYIETSGFFFEKKVVSVEITNTSEEAITIEHILLDWAASNKALTEVQIDGQTVYDEETTDTTALINNWLSSSEDLRTIDAGETITISFVFVERVSTDVDDYGLQIDFGSGLVLVL